MFLRRHVPRFISREPQGENHRDLFAIPQVSFSIKPDQVPLFESDGQEGVSRRRHGRRFGRPALTDKDTILLADFVNATGDPVFDDTLKRGLTVQLEQSPYLNIFPEERARETLSLMERPRDEKITRELGREICQRRGAKALLVRKVE